MESGWEKGRSWKVGVEVFRPEQKRRYETSSYSCAEKVAQVRALQIATLVVKISDYEWPVGVLRYLIHNR